MAERDQTRLRIGADFFQQFIADRAVDHLPHVRLVAEDERHVEDVQLVDHRPERADRDARDLQRADLRLLDHLLLAAELHLRIHLQREAAVGRFLELVAHAHDRLDRGIAQRMHVGSLDDHLLLGERGDGAAQHRGSSGADEIAAKHGILLW